MPTKFFNLDRDPQLTANSDYFIASQKAVKTALDTKADKESTYTKEEVNDLLTNNSNLPDQEGNSGKALVTDGENASWEYTSVINDVTNASETGLSKLVINKLSQEEYNNLLEQDAIQDNELYIINDGNSQYVTDEELQQSLVTKADVDNVYTKEEVYTKNEVDNIVSAKADQETTYTKTEVDNIVSTKADVETTYTKEEVDSLLENVGGGDNLPEQTDNAGKALVTDGTNASWEYTSKINDITNANETGLSQLVINKVTMAEYRELQNAGLINENELYMTEELGGSNLPSQTGHEGKFLTTNGINPSWNYASVLNQNGVSTGLSQLVINEVTQEEYNALIESDAVKDDEIYMIQDVDTDYVTQSELESRLENIGGGNAGRNIGDIFYTTRLDAELNGAVECNGAIFNINDYEGEQSIGNLLSNGSLPYISLADYENAWKTNGSVRCFGWDGGDEFRVPTLQDVYIKAGIADTFDEFNAESLPNITGTLGTFATSPSASTTADSVNKSGAFNQTVGTTLKQSLTTVTENAWARTANVQFNASDSNDTYQDNAKVNPDNIRYRAMVQLYNGAKEIAIVDYTSQVEEAVAQGIQEIETAVSNGINTNIPVIDLGTVTGEQLLEVNKAYKMILNGSAISFNMDSVEIVADVVNQIKIYLQVKRNTTIDWGTTYFYNGTIPEITGGQYEIYYEYNHNLGTWVVGAMSVGVA